MNNITLETKIKYLLGFRYNMTGKRAVLYFNVNNISIFSLFSLASVYTKNGVYTAYTLRIKLVSY